MRLNWRKFFIVFGLLQVALLMAGCSAAWLGAVSALLPVLETAVSAAIAFVAALEGKTVPASVSAAIQKIGQDIATQITNVQQLIAVYQNAASTGTLSQIQALFQAIVANLGSILSAFQVTDSTTVSKFTQLVGLCVAAAQAILAIIPLVAVKLASGASRTELEADDKLAAANVKQVEAGLKSAYVAVISESTTNADVNTALSTLPRSL
jgi:hypothetical protein